MSLYVDTSALLKLYVAEPDSDDCERLLSGDTGWVAAEHTYVEVRRNLARLFTGGDLAEAKGDFASDWAALTVVPVDTELCRVAADVAEETGAKTLDALHLAAARVAEVDRFVTFDRTLAQAATAVGLVVADISA